MKRNSKLSIKLVRITEEIKKELEQLTLLIDEHNDINKISDETVRIYLRRARASIFSDFYTGIERIFEKIARELNGGIPAGPNWHRQLLTDMTLKLPNIRPQVISDKVANDLKEFLGFRHLFRNLYGFLLDEKKLTYLSRKFKPVFNSVVKELRGFIDFLGDM